MVTNGRHVLVDVGQAADHGQRADAAKLVNARAAGNIGAVADGHVPANMALLVRITWLPRRQSWATWALAINRQWSPMIV